MPDCDVTLKLLLAEPADETLRLVGAGGRVTRWLNVEMPAVQNRRVDLLAELDTGDLLHIELQRENDPQMALRMVEYAVCILRRGGRYPRQVLLYVGNDRMRMPDRIEAEGMRFRYSQVDVRDLDGSALLASEGLSDNILAVLARVEDRMDTIRRIFAKILPLEPAKRADALQRLLITCGMRGFNQEFKEMAISWGIEDSEILGPPYRKGKEEGKEEGKKEVVRRQIERRFGPLPSWAEDRLNGISQNETDDLALRIFDAGSLTELLGPAGPR